MCKVFWANHAAFAEVKSSGTASSWRTRSTAPRSRSIRAPSAATTSWASAADPCFRRRADASPGGGRSGARFPALEGQSMSDSSMPAGTGAADAGRITYHEKPELGFPRAHAARPALDRGERAALRLRRHHQHRAGAVPSAVGGLRHAGGPLVPLGPSDGDAGAGGADVPAVPRLDARAPDGAGRSGNALRALGFAIDLLLVGLVLFIQLWTLWDIDAFHMRYGEKETAGPDRRRPSDRAWCWRRRGARSAGPW